MTLSHLYRKYSSLRDVSIPKYGCFFVKVPKGGGVISDTKNYIANFLVSERYILVVNFGKNVQKGGRGVISNPKNFIANLRKLAHIYELLPKKAQCNFQKVTGGGQGRLGILQKNIHILG